MKTQYWFYLEPYVILTCRSKDCLFYNALSGEYLLYRDHPLIASLARRLKMATNMRVIKLSASDLENNELSAFIRKIRNCFMGDLIDIRYSRSKPVLMNHRPKIQKGVAQLKKGEGRSVGEEVLEYLWEVSLFVNAVCDQQCPGCGRFHKQFLCCTRTKRRKQELSVASISGFLNQIGKTALSRLNILGGNLFHYSRLNDLLKILGKNKAEVTYFLHYLHLAGLSKGIGSLDFGTASLQVMVTPPYLEDGLPAVFEKIRGLGARTTVVWVVQDEDNIRQAEKMNAAHRIEHSTLKPFYNGSNMAFFQQHVFMSADNIFAAHPTQLEIYANMTVNRLNFGRLVVFSDGSVHAGLNAPSLGNIGKNSVHEILFKEMSYGRTWCKTRGKVYPCRNCVMADLCPPIGTYEAALKRNDLCHVRWG